MNAVTKLSVLLQLLPAIYGAIELSCGATHPRLPSSMTCLCKRKAGIGIDWFSNDTFRSNCLLSSGCLPPRNGSIFSINETEYVYNMTVSSYSYSECQRFTCKDVSNSSIQQNKTPSAIAFDSTTPTYITEPVSNHTSGNISITTSCISGYSDLRIKWFKIVDASREPYIPDPTKEIYDLDQSSCTSCNNESAATLTVGFRHEEVAVGTDTQEVQFELEISHPDFLLNALDRITRNVYEIKGTTKLPSTKPQSTKYNTNTTISTAELDTKTTPQTYTDTSISQTNTSLVHSEKQNSQILTYVFIVAGVSVLVIFLLTMLIYFLVLRRNNKPELKYVVDTDEQAMPSDSL